jgi:spermidine synthase
MRLDDPVALVNEYTRKMMAFLLFCPRPRDIVILGLGGGSLVKFCRKHLPETRVTVVEIDAAVIALREQFAIPPDDEWLRVVHADAATHVADMVQAGERTEVLLVDAYDRRGMARSVTARQFLEQSRCVLGDAGVFVMNLAAFESDAGRMRAAIREAFGGPVLSVRVGWGGNTVVFAGPALADAQRLESVAARAQQVHADLRLDFQRLPQLVRDYLSETEATERGTGAG